MARGRLHLYLGDGKGKSTAAAGMALRTLGWGGRVLLARFMKGRKSGEIEALKRAFAERVTILEDWDGRFVKDSPTSRQRACCDRLKAAVKARLAGERYDLVVLDEALDAVAFGLMDEEELLALIEAAGEAEVALTGREAPAAVWERADLISRIRKERHYFDRGDAARKGIEF